MAIWLSVIHQGLIFSLVAVAVYLTSRIIKKDDLSVEGSFGFGGAITAVLLSQVNPIYSLFIAALCGGMIGSCTGLLYSKLKMNHLMAGLVTTTACFSLSLAVASANVSIPNAITIFAPLNGLSERWMETIILLAIVAFLIFIIVLFLRSELGLLIRAVGDNPDLLEHFGKSKDFYQIAGFTIANSLTAIAGCLFVQWSGFFSITGNVGTLITGLASLMIAELITKHLGFSIVFASMIYQTIFAATLWIGLPPVWNNLGKAVIIIALVAISHLRQKNRI